MTLRNACERQVIDWLAQHGPDMLDLTAKLVNIDSGSYDKPGVDEVGTVLRRFLETANVDCDVMTIAERGDALRATVSGPAGNRPIMLMGHRDTVFDKGEAASRPFTIKDGRAYGPGVADMKSGLVMNAFILAAFAKFGGAPAPVIGLFTGDEEIGSAQSRPIIEAEASRAQAVFNSEPGRASGNIVTARKGGVFFRCDISGKSAHSGANFQDGVSAIEELARKIQTWHGMTDLDAGTTVNIGLVAGGQSVNSVAPHASCEIDLRYVRPHDRDALVGHNWGFVPMSEDQIQHMAAELKPIIQKHNVVICYYDGEPAAFGLVLPNINRAIHDFNGKLLPFNWAKFCGASK